MTIVIPCAGKATRWGKEGSGWRPYGPMPLIMVAGKPILEWALCGLSDWGPAAHLVLVPGPSEGMERYCEEDVPRITKFQRRTAYLTSWKGGELETVLAARDAIAPNEPLLVAHSNVYLRVNPSDVIAGVGDGSRAVAVVRSIVEPLTYEEQKLDSFRSHGDPIEAGADGHVQSIGKWSPYPKFESVGMFYFASAGEFIELGSDIQRRGLRTDGELRIQSVIEAYLGHNWRVGTVAASEVWPLRWWHDATRFEEWGGAPGATESERGLRWRCKYETEPSWLVEYPESSTGTVRPRTP